MRDEDRSRPSDRLIALVRDAGVDGREPRYEKSAHLLQLVAADQVELNALLTSLETLNDAPGVSRVLHRHTRNARQDMQREIDRMDHLETSAFFWGQSGGVAIGIFGATAFVSGALSGGLALIPIAVGVGLFGAATAERVRSGAEKDALRRRRDDLVLLDEELDDFRGRLDAASRRGPEQ